MKVKFIGTGSMTSKKYNSASTLINDEILIDIPNGGLKALHRGDVDINKIKAVLITHFHGDHFFDLPFLLCTRTYEENKVADIPFYVICPKSEIKKIKKVFELAFPKWHDSVMRKANINIIGIKNKDILDNIIEGYNIEVIRVPHSSKIQAFGYVITDKLTKKKLGITGDARLSDEVEYIVNNSDVTVADMSVPTTSKQHMGYGDLKKLVQKNEKPRIYATHMRDITREAVKKEKVYGLFLPKDYDEINV